MTTTSVECRTGGVVPTCIWGQCVNSSYCQCFDGYENDMIIMRFENCGLPRSAFNACAGVALTLCIFGAIINVYVGRNTLKGSLLRKLCVSATITNVFFSALVADILISHKISPQGIVFYLFGLISICYAFSYLILSVLLPVSRFNKAIAFKFVPWRRFWLIFVPAFCGIGVVITFLGAYVFTAPEDYRMFNRWISGQGIMFMVIVAIAVPAFTSFTGVLIEGLEQAQSLANRMDAEAESSSSATGGKHTSINNSNRGSNLGLQQHNNTVAGGNNNNATNNRSSNLGVPQQQQPSGGKHTSLNNNNSRLSNSGLPIRTSSTNDNADYGAATLQRQLFVKELLVKVHFIRRAVLLAGVVLFTLATIATVLQLTTGTIPVFWVVYLSGPTGISLFTLEMAYYTRKRREAERRRSTLIPAFLAGVGRQISGGIRRSTSRRNYLFGTAGSSKEGDGGGDVALAIAGDPMMNNNNNKYLHHHMNQLDVPSTVKEEPTQMGHSVADGGNNMKDSMRVRFASHNMSGVDDLLDRNLHNNNKRPTSAGRGGVIMPDLLDTGANDN